MVGWLVYDKIRLARNRTYAHMIERWCAQHYIKLHLLLAEDVGYALGPTSAHFFFHGGELRVPDFAVFRCEENDLRRTLELCDVVVSNGSRIGRIANDKLHAYELAHALGLPYLEVCDMRTALCTSSFPLVAKPRQGHGGRDVRVVRSREELEDYALATPEFDEEELLFQRVAPTVGKDLRVYVLGGDVVAAMLRTAPEGAFLANYCKGGSASQYGLGAHECKLVNRIAQALGDGYYGIDFLFDEDGNLLFNEIEDVVGSRMLYAQTNIDVVDLHMRHVIELCDRRRA